MAIIDNLLDPGQCPHQGKPVYVGIQQDGKGGSFALYNCPDCKSTLTMRTIEQHRRERSTDASR